MIAENNAINTITICNYCPALKYVYIKYIYIYKHGFPYVSATASFVFRSCFRPSQLWADSKWIGWLGMIRSADGGTPSMWQPWASCCRPLWFVWKEQEQEELACRVQEIRSVGEPSVTMGLVGILGSLLGGWWVSYGALGLRGTLDVALVTQTGAGVLKVGKKMSVSITENLATVAKEPFFHSLYFTKYSITSGFPRATPPYIMIK